MSDRKNEEMEEEDPIIETPHSFNDPMGVNANSPLSESEEEELAIATRKAEEERKALVSRKRKEREEEAEKRRVEEEKKKAEEEKKKKEEAEKREKEQKEMDEEEVQLMAIKIVERRRIRDAEYNALAKGFDKMQGDISKVMNDNRNDPLFSRGEVVGVIKFFDIGATFRPSIESVRKELLNLGFDDKDLHIDAYGANNAQLVLRVYAVEEITNLRQTMSREIRNFADKFKCSVKWSPEAYHSLFSVRLSNIPRRLPPERVIEILRQADVPVDQAHLFEYEMNVNGNRTGCLILRYKFTPNFFMNWIDSNLPRTFGTGRNLLAKWNIVHANQSVWEPLECVNCNYIHSPEPICEVDPKFEKDKLQVKDIIPLLQDTPSHHLIREIKKEPSSWARNGRGRSRGGRGRGQQ